MHFLDEFSTISSCLTSCVWHWRKINSKLCQIFNLLHNVVFPVRLTEASVTMRPFLKVQWNHSQDSIRIHHEQHWWLDKFITLSFCARHVIALPQSHIHAWLMNIECWQLGSNYFMKSWEWELAIDVRSTSLRCPQRDIPKKKTKQIYLDMCLSSYANKRPQIVAACQLLHWFPPEFISWLFPSLQIDQFETKWHHDSVSGRSRSNRYAHFCFVSLCFVFLPREFGRPLCPESAACSEALPCAGGNTLPYLIITQMTMRMFVRQSISPICWGVFVVALPVC